ncbi:MAG TPA: S8 family serine peptidase, partial [Candidatus Limnocylindrales bacterium]
DSGIDYVHFDLSGPQPVYPEFNGNYRGGWDFVNNDDDPMDDNGHGTHVSGILAADKNGYLVVGVSPRVDLYALKVDDANGNGEYSSVIAALQWAVDHGINVVNMSIGGHEASQALADAVEAAYQAHVLMVAAAGNVNPMSWYEVIFGCPVVVPAAYPHVLATTYTNPANELTGYSCTGSQVDFAAPGDQVFSPVPVGTCMLCSPYGYQPLSGTSMASPHLAGLVALVLSHGINDTNGDDLLFDEVKAHLCANTDPGGRIATTDPRYPNWYGCGVINAGKALVDNPPPLGPAPNVPPVALDDTASTAYGSPVSVPVLANDSDPDGDPLSVVSVTTPAHGTATIDAGTTVTYTPAAGYSGADGFGYGISDGRGGTASATVSVTVGPAPPTVMHIGDLDRSASAARRNWTAQVIILVLDQFGLPVSGATVNGTWSGAAKGGGSCITTAPGICTIAKSGLSLAKTSITFTVTAVAKSGATYDRTKNVDADQPSDSNGTVIMISRP